MCQVLGADHKSFSESIKISPSLCHHVILRLRPNPVRINGEKTGYDGPLMTFQEALGRRSIMMTLLNLESNYSI